MDASVERSEIGATRDRLGVMIGKSANSTLSVAVHPRTPVLSQLCQTSSTSGPSSETFSHIEISFVG
jgi:hypothetical protein